jgi:hypothetical protein
MVKPVQTARERWGNEIGLLSGENALAARNRRSR